jgi:hypothetical protein
MGPKLIEEMAYLFDWLEYLQMNGLKSHWNFDNQQDNCFELSQNLSKSLPWLFPIVHHH